MKRQACLVPFVLILSLNAARAQDYYPLTNVVNWGAVGNGVFDNTAAFQAALNWVGNGGGVFQLGRNRCCPTWEIQIQWLHYDSRRCNSRRGVR
jgi:hypothetical protein